MAIETLNIDGQEVKVSETNADIQRLVQVYEETHMKRVGVENEHIVLSAALRSLSTDIVTATQQHLKSIEESAVEE